MNQVHWCTAKEMNEWELDARYISIPAAEGYKNCVGKVVQIDLNQGQLSGQELLYNP